MRSGSIAKSACCCIGRKSAHLPEYAIGIDVLGRRAVLVERRRKSGPSLDHFAAVRPNRGRRGRSQYEAISLQADLVDRQAEIDDGGRAARLHGAGIIFGLCPAGRTGHRPCPTLPFCNLGRGVAPGSNQIVGAGRMAAIGAPIDTRSSVNGSRPDSLTYKALIAFSLAGGISGSSANPEFCRARLSSRIKSEIAAEIRALLGATLPLAT